MASVSPATVSNVMNGRRPDDDEIAQRVKKAAEVLGYSPTRAAANLRSGKVPIVAALVPEIDNPFFSSIVGNIEALAGENGYELIVASSSEDETTEASRLKAMLAWQPAGLFVIPTHDDFLSRKLVEESEVPYVVIDRMASTLFADVVSVDNRAAGRLAADHLLDVGCQNILIAASSLSIHNMTERCAGAQEIAWARGLRQDQVRIVEAGSCHPDATEVLSQYLSSDKRPDAILAMTNKLTLSAVSAIIANEVAIPRDLALVGFDDYEWMSARKTPITAVSQPIVQIVEAAWRQLSQRIEGDEGMPIPVTFECGLHERASTLGFRPTDIVDSKRSVNSDIRGSPDE
ncbi:MAG: LacI family DNA-binding transcriptional regulator [Sulfitobacter sp.]|nr:LacI family DNA-binding transcriptional regulator [Sulfitobacter sp.]